MTGDVFSLYNTQPEVDTRWPGHRFQVVRKSLCFKDTAFNIHHNGRKIVASVMHCDSTNDVFMKKAFVLRV